MASLKVSWMAVLNCANYATNKITTVGYKKFFRGHKLNRNVDWKKKKGKISVPSMLALKKKVVNKLIFVLRSARGIVWKARHLWMRTRKHSYKKAWVCGEIYCIMHNHTENTSLLGIVLHSFLLKKMKLSWRMQNIITNTVVHLGCNDMQAHRQKEQEWVRSGECQFPCWKSDYCQASEDLLHGLFFFLFKSTVSQGYYGNSWTYKLGHVATMLKPYSSSF